MGSLLGDDITDERAKLRARVSDSDHALLLASAAWGSEPGRSEAAKGSEELTSTILTGLRKRLTPGWFQNLSAALEHAGSPLTSTDQRRASDELGQLHRATASVDMERVHSSWLVRALQEESASVQRLVTASLAETIRHRVQAGLLLDSRDLTSERPASSEVASWVMALWTERLVGDEPERPDDPPALFVLVRLTPSAGYRVCRMAGFCKLVLASELSQNHPTPGGRARFTWLADRLANADEQLRALAERDVTLCRSSKTPLHHQPARIGLTTVARLLAEIEPFRLRWALQHWPYPIAKLIRSVLSLSTSSLASVAEAESTILRIAWDRLNLEGRLAPGWPAAYASASGIAAADQIAGGAISARSSPFDTN
jgi:hypothetical protein